MFEYKKNIKDGNKKKEIVKMAQENLHMLKRLSQKTSCYDFSKYKKEYDQAQYYKESLCVFPPIDFYKTRTNSFRNNAYSTNNFHSDKYYCTVSSNMTQRKKGVNKSVNINPIKKKH